MALCLGAASDNAGDDEPSDVPRQRTVDPAVEVQVVVDLATLAGLADEPALLRSHGPIPAEVARRWMADATSWRRLVSDPVSGHLLDYGPRVRFAPNRLRQLLTARDQRCIFPACRQPAERCDLDHHPPWRPDGSGGTTSSRDMAPLCRQHHLWVTHGGWRLERQSDGANLFTSPSGRRYRVRRPKALDG